MERSIRIRERRFKLQYKDTYGSDGVRRRPGARAQINQDLGGRCERIEAKRRLSADESRPFREPKVAISQDLGGPWERIEAKTRPSANQSRSLRGNVRGERQLLPIYTPACAYRGIPASWVNVWHQTCVTSSNSNSSLNLTGPHAGCLSWGRATVPSEIPYLKLVGPGRLGTRELECACFKLSCLWTTVSRA